jgi:hypothetical protein
MLPSSTAGPPASFRDVRLSALSDNLFYSSTIEQSLKFVKTLIIKKNIQYDKHVSCKKKWKPAYRRRLLKPRIHSEKKRKPWKKVSD